MVLLLGILTVNSDFARNITINDVAGCIETIYIDAVGHIKTMIKTMMLLDT